MGGGARARVGGGQGNSYDTLFPCRSNHRHSHESPFSVSILTSRPSSPPDVRRTSRRFGREKRSSYANIATAPLSRCRLSARPPEERGAEIQTRFTCEIVELSRRNRKSGASPTRERRASRLGQMYLEDKAVTPPPTRRPLV